MVIAFCVLRNLFTLCCKDFPLFSKSFLVSAFIFSPVIYLELIFMKQKLRLFFFPYGYPVVEAPFIESIFLSLLSKQFWHLRQKSIDYKNVKSISRLCYVPLIYLSILMPMPYCFVSIAQAFRLGAFGFWGQIILCYWELSCTFHVLLDM